MADINIDGETLPVQIAVTSFKRLQLAEKLVEQYKISLGHRTLDLSSAELSRYFQITEQMRKDADGR